MSCSASFISLRTLSPLRFQILVVMKSSYLLTLPSAMTVCMAVPNAISLLYILAVSMCLDVPSCSPFLRSSVMSCAFCNLYVPKPCICSCCLLGRVSTGGPRFFFSYYAMQLYYSLQTNSLLSHKGMIHNGDRTGQWKWVVYMG